MPFGQLKIDECAEKTGLRLKFSILFRRERGMLPHGFQELIDTADTLISTRPRIEQVARRRHRFRRKHIIIGVSGLIARNVRTVFESFGKSLGQITLKLGGAELSVTVNIRIKTVKVKRRRQQRHHGYFNSCFHNFSVFHVRMPSLHRTRRYAAADNNRSTHRAVQDQC